MWNVIRFLRPGIFFRNGYCFEFSQGFMLQNYFKLAFRHLHNNKFFSAINALGLAVGMASAFLIIQYVGFELSYDRFHVNEKEIYRVATEQHDKDAVAATFYGVGPYLKEHFPEVTHMAHLYRWPANTGAILLARNKIYNERNYLFAEPDFFKIFPSLLAQGDASTCLSDPNSIVLSKRAAEKMFGKTDAVGQVVVNLEGGKKPLTVTGIMENTPENSHFEADVVIPYDMGLLMADWPHWKYPNQWTYLTIKEGTNVYELEKRLNAALQHEQKDNAYFQGASMLLQPITSIHLNSHLKDEIEANGNITSLFALTIAAIIISLMAWFNYVNLEISRFLNRAREVGVRRVIGSTRRELVTQFFVQYLCLVLIAALMAGLLVYLVLPYYQSITGAPITFTGGNSKIWWVAGILFVSGAVLAGIFPAYFISGFNPIQSLKGRIGRVRTIYLRGPLLSFQFCSTIVLLGILIIVREQLTFMRKTGKNMELGQILIVPNPTNYTRYEDSLRSEKNLVFRDELMRHAGMANFTTSSAIPGESVGFTYQEELRRSMAEPIINKPFKLIFIDYNFIPVFKLEILAGRNYSADRGEDNAGNSLILTESAIHDLGFGSAGEALEKEIYFMVSFDWKKYKIIGVVKDYHHESVKEPVHPTILFLHRNRGQMVYYSVLMDQGGGTEKSLASVKEAWKVAWPEKPFDYFFADTYYDQQYKSEVYFERIFGVFAGVAVFIAGLGILGMTLFDANSRRKEISIRKVLGATVANLVTMLNRDHVWRASLALLISIPVIYYVATQWLSGYPVRIGLSPWYFILPFLILLLTVFLASGIQTVKAASVNPVDNLKYE